jgi:hypothetical protein
MMPNFLKKRRWLRWLLTGVGAVLIAIATAAAAAWWTMIRMPGESYRGELPDAWVRGVGLSDHWSFWQEGYPALMVSDTAMFRNPHYHELSDTIDTLDFDRMARVVRGLEGVVADLTGS